MTDICYKVLIAVRLYFHFRFQMYKVTADELNVGNLVDAVVSRIAVKEIIAVWSW